MTCTNFKRGWDAILNMTKVISQKYISWDIREYIIELNWV
jgi:hypothetical protein